MEPYSRWLDAANSLAEDNKGTWDRFCTACGAELVYDTISTGRFATDTGEPTYNLRIYCPERVGMSFWEDVFSRKFHAFWGFDHMTLDDIRKTFRVVYSESKGKVREPNYN